jgi:hypothetical protein
VNWNWKIIGDKIFGILKGSGFKLQMFDKTGAKTLDPHEATRFFATIGSDDTELKEYSILISVHDENADSHIDIKTPNLKSENDFEFIRKIRDILQKNVGDREGLSVNWFKFDHTITPKDDAVNNITESKDISKPFGSTKSSYQRVGDAKLIIRHTDTVNEEKVGSRWRHVKAIFIENRIGERFMYKHLHIAGARAMARHLSNAGAVHDEIGESIQALSSDYTALKESARLLRCMADESKTSSIRASLQEINKKVKRLCGPRGYTALSDSMRERVINEESEQISSIYEDLLERCGCERDSNDSNVLRVAARYLASAPQNVDGAATGIGFTREPDLTSKAGDYPDHKSRLAWQIAELAECVDDEEVGGKLLDISAALRDYGNMDPKDMDLIRMVFKASKGIAHEPDHQSEPEVQPGSGLDRIRKLSGI